MNAKKPSPPVVLSTRGRKLWRDLHAVFEFDAHETAVVIEACRLLDTIDSLQAAITTDGVMLTGSQGQLVVNGAVAELRQQQLALTRLLTALNLDAATAGGNGVAMQREISSKAKKAADARWSRSKAVRGG